MDTLECGLYFWIVQVLISAPILMRYGLGP